MIDKKPRNLILHIGAHKTGSSAIQIFLRRSNPELHKLGWAFAFRPGKRANWGHLIKFKPEENGAGASFTLARPELDALFEHLDKGRRNIILSAEDLFFLDGPEIKLLCEGLAKRFDGISIVCYLRRQDQMALSQWAQGAKTLQSALIFGQTQHIFPDLTLHSLRYLDYATKIEQWSAALPQAHLIVRAYDRTQFPDGNVVADFVAAVGLRLPPDEAPDEVNTALGATTARFIYLLRQNGFTQKQINGIVTSGLLPVTSDKILPSRAEAEAFMDLFADSNARLPGLLGQKFAFSADYSKYPKKAVLPPLDPDYVRDALMVLLADALKQRHAQPA
ncbi:hypothetical protein GC209_15075 [bacterium]|nr:hypothetical protein [bacterium]